MIKKFIKGLFGLFVIGFCFINFSSAGTVQSVGLDKQNSEYNSAFKVGFIKGGGVLSEYLGTAKSVLALDSNVLFWWAENGQPYFYAPGFQGFFGEFYTCNVLTGTNSPLASNCQATTLTDDYKNIFKSFFSKVKQGDYAGYDYFYNWTSGGNGYNHQARIQVCFSSEEIENSLCFRYSTCSLSSNLSYCNGRNYGSLVNSQNLSNLTFANIPNSYISYAPGQFGYDGGDSLPSGDLTNVSCPTVSQLIANYNQNGFYSGLCYSSDKIFNGSSFVSVQSQSIFDLFSSKDDFISSLNKFGTYCESSVYNNDVCVQAFSGEELRFNLISKIPKVDALGGRKSLYTYCGLYNYDPNATTCVASGVLPEYGSDYTVEDVVHSINNSQYSVFSPVTNNFEYDTVFNNGSGYEYSGDIISNIQLLFGKFTSLFKQQISNTNGVLPGFIIIPFLIVVLFKLFKK